MNKATISGNIGHDLDGVRYTQAGTAVVNMRVATNEFYNDKEGNRQKRTDWHRVVVFGRNAENCSRFLKKGSKVLVEGRLQTRSYIDKDEVTRYPVEIIANRVEFLDRAGARQQDEPAPSSTPDAPPADVDTDYPF